MRVVAIQTLRSRFSLALLPQDQIVTTGIYSRIRHPSYLGSLLIIAGVAILYAPAGITLLAWAFFRARIVAEEVWLSQNPQYQQYRKRAGMFLPKWRR